MPRPTGEAGSEEVMSSEPQTAGRFQCSICAERSTHICIWCTKDACVNHLCTKCFRCSDCCECELRLDETTSTPESITS